MSTILLAVEIAAVLLAAVFAVLWMRKPTGPYEPVTFIALLLGSTVVEIIRRYLPQQTTAGADTVEIAALTEQAAELLRRLQDGRDRLEPASSPSSQTPPQVEDRSAESQDPLTERIYSLVTIQSGLVERLRKLAQLRGITIDEANPLKTHSVSSPFDDAVMKILDFATDIGRKHPIDIQHSDWVDKMAAAVNGYLDHIIENTERGTSGLLQRFLLCVFSGRLSSGKEGVMPKHDVVQLSEDQRGLLYALIQKGNAPARAVRRAHTLLLADEQQPVQIIAAMLHTSAVTVTQTCKRFLHAGLEAALYDRPRPGSRRKLDGRHEAHLVALAGSTPPAGRDRWRLRLLADRLVALGLVEEISYATVRRVLKKTGSSRG